MNQSTTSTSPGEVRNTSLNNNISNKSLTSSLVTILSESDITTEQQTVINIMYIIIAIVGVFGNLIALSVILTHPPIRKFLLNYFFINKTVVDFLLSLLLVPSVTVNLIPFGYSTYPLCLIWQSRVFFLSLCNVSLYSILALSVERYLEIVHPIWHKINVTRAKIILTIVVCWFISFVQKFGYILPTTKPVNGICMLGKFYANRAASSVAGFSSSFTDFIFPMFVIFFCYIQMWRSLRNKLIPQPTPNAFQLEQSGMKSNVTRARRRILQILIIMVIIFVFSNTYKQTLLFLKLLFIAPLDLNSVNFNISQILSFVSSAVDPFVYLLNHKEFRIGFYKLFKLEKLMRRGTVSS